MTTREFMEFFAKRYEELYKTTEAAQREYADPANVFDNFDRLASDLNLDRKKVLYVYMKKHLDAIRNFLNDPSRNVREPIHKRIGDVIVYLMILDAMIQDEFTNKVGQVTEDTHILRG